MSMESVEQEILVVVRKDGTEFLWPRMPEPGMFYYEHVITNLIKRMPKSGWRCGASAWSVVKAHEELVGLVVEDTTLPKYHIIESPEVLLQDA